MDAFDGHAPAGKPRPGTFAGGVQWVMHPRM